MAGAACTCWLVMLALVFPHLCPMATAAPVPRTVAPAPDPLAPACLIPALEDVRLVFLPAPRTEVRVRWTGGAFTAGEAILALNGHKIESCDGLRTRLAHYRPGAAVLVTVRTVEGRVVNRGHTLAAWELWSKPATDAAR